MRKSTASNRKSIVVCCNSSISSASVKISFFISRNTVISSLILLVHFRSITSRLQAALVTIYYRPAGLLRLYGVVPRCSFLQLPPQL
ncbi:hypothetical protein DTO166G4_880 [Paecilomyces variotii]|nr:hypothetical protein DTO164E3_2477 [Paecilomyces variotii]KAJ9206897.1 hypothetical protein DTO032I3_1485 [Paecilomyces variotii]KAJ9217698.1 hypothetical protein DTO166G4_880 [Paecilomyces variotii]KAJ9226365.1 hypothetical protein DTO169C6_1093 [Paecilomyces variotii]KAJ9242931.1 hypothetical protein DTO166G5_35 [Paecilomyces variotii]